MTKQAGHRDKKENPQNKMSSFSYLNREINYLAVSLSENRTKFIKSRDFYYLRR